MARKKLSFTSRYVLAFGLLMLFANTLLGIVILIQSNTTVRSLINKNMLDVVRSAANLLDGDALGALTEADVDGPVFRDVEERLSAFQTHEDIQFIYAVKQAGENTFVFTVDPDPVDPGAFGEEIVVTDALIQAGKGQAAVDSVTAEDRWGNFYSAYCPVFDSAGKVAGIVGIDFDANWYDATIRKHTISIAIITILSVLIGGVLVFLLTHHVKKRFRQLDTDLSRLSVSMDQMIEGAGGCPGTSDSGAEKSSEDEIEKLAVKIHTMQEGLTTFERLQRDQYYNDAVTGIPNLNFFRQFADERVNVLRLSHQIPTILYFDVRSMVSYNTEYGYSRGDELLRLTARTIQAAFPAALVVRGEGDHFIAIDVYADGIEPKIRQISETIKKEAYGRSAGIQCGIVRIEPEMKVVEAIERARNTIKLIGDDLNVVCRFYSNEEDSDDQMNRYIIQHFEEAMQREWIRVFYQPILKTDSKKIAILEALARWRDPERGMISPGQFIPVLSRYHLLHRLDLYMVDRVCREFEVRKEAGLPLIPVSVNFSAQDFDYTDVPRKLREVTERYALTPDDIIVEITEQDLAEGTDKFREALKQIRADGFRLWIDDFGSGYSSLNVFSQYDVDRIKFDMDLVRHLDDNNGANRRILDAMVKVCRELGVNTLTEGVETEAQYHFLKEIGCDMVQGFYFFKPDPVEISIDHFRHRTADIPHEIREERMKKTRGKAGQ